MAKHNTTGTWGERVAHDYLTAQGYAIIENNWRSGHYELDLVAMHGNRIVFIEVKTRSNDDFDPAAAVGRRKMRRLAIAADAFIRCHDYPHEIQFDIITVIGDETNYTIDHIPDAFIAPMRTY